MRIQTGSFAFERSKTRKSISLNFGRGPFGAEAFFVAGSAPGRASGRRIFDSLANVLCGEVEHQFQIFFDFVRLGAEVVRTELGAGGVGDRDQSLWRVFFSFGVGCCVVVLFELGVEAAAGFGSEDLDAEWADWDLGSALGSGAGLASAGSGGMTGFISEAAAFFPPFLRVLFRRVWFCAGTLESRRRVAVILDDWHFCLLTLARRFSARRQPRALGKPCVVHLSGACDSKESLRNSAEHAFVNGLRFEGHRTGFAL